MSKVDLNPEELEILMGFVEEAREMLDDAEPRLIELEKISNQSGSVDIEVINTIFRLFHSLKGGASFLDLGTVQKITHQAETLLDMFRKGKATINSSHIDILNRTCDFIRLLLDNIDSHYTDKGFENDAALIEEDLKQSLSTFSTGSSNNHRKASPDPRKGIAETQYCDNPAKEAELPSESYQVNQVSAETPRIDNPPASESVDQTVPLKEENTEELKLTITPEMVQQFVSESIELLETAEEALLNLEKDPHNAEVISQVFRAIHSFKGNSGFFGYSDLEEIGHQAETVLDEIREGKEVGSNEVFTLLLEIIDFLRGSVSQLSEGGNGSVPGKHGLINLLKDAAKRLSTSTENTESATECPEPEIQKNDVNDSTKSADIQCPGVEANAKQKASEKTRSEGNKLKENSENIPTTSTENSGGEESRSGIDRRQAGRRSTDSTAQRQSVRVDVEKLDSLLDLVGELVISEAMVAQNPDIKSLNISLDRFEKSVLQLDKITRDLQDVITSIRMIPLSSTFRRMIRLVRDLSQKAKKKVDLEIIGEETEMDKTVIELINDPLVHIIRNSIDHGLETPDERISAGKLPEGHVVLEAKYVGGEVWISIRDDGRGLDREKILRKAHEKGLIPDDGVELRDEEVWQIVFQPGFSTADKVTDVSGRGVGMDVVRRNIENIRGKVDIYSRKGDGTKIVLRIPLTLAIIDGMIVRVGKTRYTIPIVDIVELWKPTKESITRLMEGQEIINNRGKLHPIIRLHELFHVGSSQTELADGIIIMAENEGKTVCLFVDEMLGQQQIVIKGLSNYIGQMPCVSGCTILGDGDISLIIDIAGIIEQTEYGTVSSTSPSGTSYLRASV